MAEDFTFLMVLLYSMFDNILGFIPSTDLNRNAGAAQKFFLRYILHGMLRFTKITRTVQQGGQAICNLVTDEKFKGT